MLIYRAMYSPGVDATARTSLQQVPFELLLLASAIALFLPNIGRFLTVVENGTGWLGQWREQVVSSRLAAAGAACLAVYIITRLDSFSEFLYFQF